MGYLLHLLAALFTIALAELDYDSGRVWPWAVLGLAGAPHLVALWVRRQTLRGAFTRGEFGLRLLGRLAPLLCAAAVLGCGWLQTLEGWFPEEDTIDRWPHPRLLLAFAPYFVYELLVIDARARLLLGKTRAFRRSRSFQVRMLLSAVLPLLVYVGLTWLAGINHSVRVNVEEVALLEAAWSGVVLVVFALLLPRILSSTWETERLDAGVQRDLLERVAERAGFRCDRFLVWRTGHQVSNAAVMGFARWHRSVLFTDLLLAQLGPRQLAAVFGHEIGHVLRRHVLVFAAWSLGFFLAADVILRAADVEDPALLLGGVTLLVACWALGFGTMSRRFELDADLVALELTNDPEALASALDTVGGSHSRRRASWRHFSVDERKLFLRAAHRDPGVAVRLRRPLRRLSLFGFTLFVVALALEVWTLAGSWSADRTYVDLRLGRFDAAVERSEEGTPEGVLARTAAQFEEGAQAEELELAALAAAEGGKWDEVRPLLELAVLRGSSSARSILRALADPEDGSEAGEELPAPWAALSPRATPGTGDE